LQHPLSNFQQLVRALWDDPGRAESPWFLHCPAKDAAGGVKYTKGGNQLSQRIQRDAAALCRLWNAGVSLKGAMGLKLGQKRDDFVLHYGTKGGRLLLRAHPEGIPNLTNKEKGLVSGITKPNLLILPLMCKVH
jgi:hypothetical protein